MKFYLKRAFKEIGYSIVSYLIFVLALTIVVYVPGKIEFSILHTHDWYDMSLIFLTALISVSVTKLVITRILFKLSEKIIEIMDKHRHCKH